MIFPFIVYSNKFNKCIGQIISKLVKIRQEKYFVVTQAYIKSFSFDHSSWAPRTIQWRKRGKKNSAYSSTRKLLLPLAWTSIINFKQKNTGIKIWNNNPPVSYNIFNEIWEFFSIQPCQHGESILCTSMTRPLYAALGTTQNAISMCCLQKQKADVI